MSTTNIRTRVFAWRRKIFCNEGNGPGLFQAIYFTPTKTFLSKWQIGNSRTNWIENTFKDGYHNWVLLLKCETPPNIGSMLHFHFLSQDLASRIQIRLDNEATWNCKHPPPWKQDTKQRKMASSAVVNLGQVILARPDDTSSRSLAFRPLHHG